MFVVEWLQKKAIDWYLPLSLIELKIAVNNFYTFGFLNALS
jgi:hypothetical protein